MDTKWTADEKKQARFMAIRLGSIIGGAPFTFCLAAYGVITGEYLLLIFLCLPFLVWPHFLAMHKSDRYFRIGFWLVSMAHTSLMLFAYYIHPVFAIGAVLLFIVWLVVGTMVTTKYVRSTVASLHTLNQGETESQ
jgi:hypothetical protein